MKGLKVERAKPSNAIDIYALLKLASAEKVFPDQNPSQKQLEQYYFQKLIPFEVVSPLHFWYLAKRGRGYLGLLHAFLMPGRWDGEINSIFVDLLFVVQNRRNMGIGKQLIEGLLKDAEELGIKDFQLLAAGKAAEKWKKDWEAKEISTFMRVKR